MMMKVITQEDWNLQWVTPSTWLRFAQSSCPLPGRTIVIFIIIIVKIIISIVIIIMIIINIFVIIIIFIYTVYNQYNYEHHCRDFAPDMVLVSAGFDAGVGHEHPIGGYKVSDHTYVFSKWVIDCGNNDNHVSPSSQNTILKKFGDMFTNNHDNNDKQSCQQ